MTLNRGVMLSSLTSCLLLAENKEWVGHTLPTTPIIASSTSDETENSSVLTLPTPASAATWREGCGILVERS